MVFGSSKRPSLILGHFRVPVGVHCPEEVELVDVPVSHPELAQGHRRDERPEVLSEDSVGLEESAVLRENRCVNEAYGRRTLCGRW